MLRFLFLVVIALLLPLSNSARSEERLLDFDHGFDVSAVPQRDAVATLVSRDGGKALRIDTGHAVQWPGITLSSGDRLWDLSAWSAVAVDLENVGPSAVNVHVRIDSRMPDGKESVFQVSTAVRPGEAKTLEVPLQRRLPDELGKVLFGMRGFPGGYLVGQGVDPSQITQLLIFVASPSEDHSFTVDNIRAVGDSSLVGEIPPTVDAMFPMIDVLGQYIHKDWPGKTHSIDELIQHARQEEADLAADPGPRDRNQYGGWTAGPERKATGNFRAEKIDGRWWLIDPEGRLFWSHGIDCVRHGGNYTPITDREHWFEELPEPDDEPLGQFRGRGGWAPHGYYHGKAYQTYCFFDANLYRVWGDDWQDRFAEQCHRRLRSWGMNSIGSWSGSDVYMQRKTPYTVMIHATRKPIEGSEGYWGKFPDPFDQGFREALAKTMAREKSTTAGDPWCLGYFVDNELSWGDEFSLAEATLSSPKTQAAKQAFVADLRRKYQSVERLNQTWSTDYASWDALLESRAKPDREKASDDLTQFYTRTAEQYFRECRDVIKQVAPNNLYLGCRFAWVNDRAARAAAKYCDVVSYNRYEDGVAEFNLPEGVDMPAIIGEFHFGALDRGMFHTGLRPVKSQQDRATAYKNYVSGALRNPHLVGTHWFQFAEQAATGRGDGENYQIGFVDACNKPYQETIEAAREIGRVMYQRRFAGE